MKATGPETDTLATYLLRSVRVGIQATGITLACLIVFPFLPGPEPLHPVAYAVLLLLGGFGAAVVAILPWQRLFERGLGMWALYMWSVLDIGLITGGVMVTGGARSELWVLYALTTLFFSVSYPARSQVALLALTAGSYLAALAVSGWDITPARLFLRLAGIALVAFVSAFLARQLFQQIHWLSEARATSENRAKLLARLHARLSEAQEAERIRVGRELHDELGQLLTSIALFARRLEADLPGSQAGRVAGIRELAERTLSRTRSLAHRLRPVALDDEGLAQAVQRLAREAQEQSGIPIDVHAEGLAAGLPDDVETGAYRIVQEALTNALRHARASSISIVLSRRKDLFTAIVEDDGQGIEDKRAARGERVGILGMRERAEAIGGEFLIESSPGGTIVRLTAPCKERPARLRATG